MYPRRMVLVALFILLHFIQETLRTLRKSMKVKLVEVTVEILSEVLKILGEINIFVQFSLACNAIMFIRSSFVSLSKLIRIITADKYSFEWSLLIESEVHTIYYLQN